MVEKSRFQIRRFIREKIAKIIFQIPQTPIEICSPDNLNLLYITNEKVASSTIKANLFARKLEIYISQGGKNISDFERIYEKPTGRVIKNEELKNKIVFSAVRNPYTRILSGFLDKSRPETTTFRKQFGKKIPDNFLDFLISLERLDPWSIDSHFRPQNLNLAIENIKYNRN